MSSDWYTPRGRESDPSPGVRWEQILSHIHDPVFAFACFPVLETLRCCRPVAWFRQQRGELDALSFQELGSSVPLFREVLSLEL